MLPEQKCQCLIVSEVSSDQSSDEPLGESSVTSSSESDSSAKKSRQHKRSKKHKLKSGMFAKQTSTVKKPQLWPHNHSDPHFVSHMPKFQDISWDQLVVGEVAILTLKIMPIGVLWGGGENLACCTMFAPPTF